jgi:hypothetical protein
MTVIKIATPDLQIISGEWSEKGVGNAPEKLAP